MGWKAERPHLTVLFIYCIIYICEKYHIDLRHGVHQEKLLTISMRRELK